MDDIKNHIEDCVYPSVTAWLRAFIDAELTDKRFLYISARGVLVLFFTYKLFINRKFKKEI